MTPPNDIFGRMLNWSMPPGSVPADDPPAGLQGRRVRKSLERASRRPPAQGVGVFVSEASHSLGPGAQQVLAHLPESGVPAHRLAHQRCRVGYRIADLLDQGRLACLIDVKTVDDQGPASGFPGLRNCGSVGAFLGGFREDAQIFRGGIEEVVARGADVAAVPAE